MEWDNYKIAFYNALVVIQNKYPYESWIAPIPEEHKKDIFNKAIKYLQMKEKAQNPSLF